MRKKDLGLMATTYGFVYVAQIAMGADQAQTLKAIREAEAYPGPSLIRPLIMQKPHQKNKAGKSSLRISREIGRASCRERV